MNHKKFESQATPFGTALPAGNPHAVSVSIPTLGEALWLFKEEDPEPWKRLEAIYPRFGDSPYVKKALEFKGADDQRTTLAVCSPDAAVQLVRIVPSSFMSEVQIEEADSLTFLSFANTHEKEVAHVKRMLKRTGGAASSRRAEDFLIAKGSLQRRYQELTSHQATEASLCNDISQLYRPAEPEVMLANSGMAAVTATLDALQCIRAEQLAPSSDNQNIWIRLGSLYHDTNDLMLDKSDQFQTKIVKQVGDYEGLQEAIQQYGPRVAAILTEAPTNPLMAVPDLHLVRQVIGDLPLVVDISTASSAGVNALPYADVVIESLTKTASGGGDVMMGAIILNKHSLYFHDLNSALPNYLIGPYNRDVRRMAYELQNVRSRVAKAGKNALRLAEFFTRHPAIENVYWTGSEHSRAAYSKIATDIGNPATVLTIETKGPLATMYDQLDLSKGPSFGTYFTLNTPYTHITHAHEVGGDDEYGLAGLKARTGLTPRMLRISVGTEDADMLLAKYDDALDA